MSLLPENFGGLIGAAQKTRGHRTSARLNVLHPFQKHEFPARDYLRHTNCPVETCAKEQVLGHYKNLLDVEEAFCQLKSYLEVRPIYHWRPDRVRNHVRLCFIAYWLSARLGKAWRACGEQGEVPRVLRRLQSIRIGQLQVGGKAARSLMTEIPKELNELLEKLGVIKLFATVPDWAL